MWQIRNFLSEVSTKTLIHAFVTSHIDYGNSLLYSIPRYQIDNSGGSRPGGFVALWCFGGFDPKKRGPPLDPPMDRLQKIMNEGALIVYHILRFCDITSALANLHCLPVQLRIHFKIAPLVFKTQHGLAPSYLAELIHLKTPGRCSVRTAVQNHERKKISVLNVLHSLAGNFSLTSLFFSHVMENESPSNVYSHGISRR